MKKHRKKTPHDTRRIENTNEEDENKGKRIRQVGGGEGVPEATLVQFEKLETSGEGTERPKLLGKHPGQGPGNRGEKKLS